MADIHGIGAFGINPYLSDDLLREIKKFANIKAQAGKVAYLLSLGKNAKKPQIKEGVHDARGALKWISSIIQEEGGK